jgi:Family of unknown function (DUF6353)
MKISAALIGNFSRKLLVVKKDSPHIFFAIGVVGSVVSTVMACRATLKLSETLDEIETDVNAIKELKHSSDETTVEIISEDGSTNVYPVETWRRDATYVYVRSAMKIVKLYAPSAMVGIASIGFLTGSHVQLTRRNSALMAAYAAVQSAFDEYRDRVREELGPDKELDIYHAAKTETVKDESGKEIEVKTVDPNKLSDYARFFDEGSEHWRKEPEYNRIFVQGIQNYSNNLLQARGHLFLNEVYDMFDIERTRAGSVVGWVMGKDGDNYVDFGLYEARNAAFLDGSERNILLDFNVDGVIYDKI